MRIYYFETIQQAKLNDVVVTDVPVIYGEADGKSIALKITGKETPAEIVLCVDTIIQTFVQH